MSSRACHRDFGRLDGESIMKIMPQHDPKHPSRYCDTLFDYSSESAEQESREDQWRPPAENAETVSPQEYLAILRMLVRRATLRDKWRARKLPGHWLNRARREILIHGGPSQI